MMNWLINSREREVTVNVEAILCPYGSHLVSRSLPCDWTAVVSQSGRHVHWQVLQDLEPAMLKQLKELAATKAQFGVGFSLSEAWDFMQLKVRHASTQLVGQLPGSKAAVTKTWQRQSIQYLHLLRVERNVFRYTCCLRQLKGEGGCQWRLYSSPIPFKVDIMCYRGRYTIDNIPCGPILFSMYNAIVYVCNGAI